MKRICLVLSALALCCTMLIGAGAVGTSSQMSLTQQAITHFQQTDAKSACIGHSAGKLMGCYPCHATLNDRIFD